MCNQIVRSKPNCATWWPTTAKATVRETRHHMPDMRDVGCKFSTILCKQTSYQPSDQNIYHGNRMEYGLYFCEQANLLLFVLTLWNLRSRDSLQGRKIEHVLRCFFLQHYEQANVGSLKATKCKLQRAYAGHGGHIAQMPR